MMRKLYFIVVAVALFCLQGIPGCALGEAARPASEWGAWVTYWDSDGALDEAAQLGDALTTLVYFAAYFDAEDAVFVPDSLYELLDDSTARFAQAMPKRYLSVVNDLLSADGDTSLKDTTLLKRLFSTQERMEAHAEELIALTLAEGFDGLEIDYEAMRGDMDLWARFADFLRILQSLAQDSGMSLRVLLEPGAPLGAVKLPPGPDYVMMCYNLYGTHSAAGPKADDAFLREMARKMAGLPGEKGFALAGGGFDWDAAGHVISLTQEQAVELAEIHGADALRDLDSGSLSFAYIGADGERHEVWYADADTLRRWRDVLAGQGASRVDLWRLGGNEGLDRLANVD